MTNRPLWEGRFPKYDIFSTLDKSYRFNLAQSTGKNLLLGELIDLMGSDSLRHFPLGYGSSIQGSAELRQEIGRRCHVDPDWVITTHGAAFALYLLASELSQPGNNALVVCPYFAPARDTLSANSLDVRLVRVKMEHDFQIDVASVSQNLDTRTRLLSLASPQNPTGVVTSIQTLQALLEVMAKKAPNAYLLVDETYREATYGSARVPQSAASISPRVLTCASVSKAHGAPGLRMGWLTVPDPDLRERLLVAKRNMVIGDSPLIEQLTTTLLQHTDSILENQRKQITECLQLVEVWKATEENRVQWVKPNAGAMCCMRLNPKHFDEQAVANFWQLLPDYELMLRPGTLFGEDDRYFRLGFGYLPIEELKEGLSRLSLVLNKAFSNLQK